MDNDFFSYLGRLEVMGFFSAYPLLYAVVHVLGGKEKGNTPFWQRLIGLLPLGYALCAVLYLGLQVRTVYPDFSVNNISNHFNYWLKVWGLLGLLFWLPFFRRNPVYSLLHSLVIFFFLLKDLYMHTIAKSGKEVVQNDMRVFTDSLILNTAALIFAAFTYYIFHAIRKYQQR